MAIKDIIKIYVTETVFQVTPSLPEPTGLVVTPIINGVQVNWDFIPTGQGLTSPIYPYYWEVRFQVEADGWGSWIDVYGCEFTRHLSATEKANYASGVSTNLALIQVQLRITDGQGNYSVNTLEDLTKEALRALNDTGDIENDAIKNAHIDALAVGTTEIANLAVTGAKIAVQTITGPKLSDGTLSATQLGSSCVEESKIANLAVTEGKLGNLAVTEGKVAADAITVSKIKNDEITAAKIKANDLTLATLAAEVTNKMFNAAGDATILETALGIAITTLDPTDEILIAGPNTNIDAGNRAAIKTSLQLNNVANKNEQDTVTDGLTAAGLTVANMFEDANVVAAVNANPGAGISNASIADVYGTKVIDGVGANPLFDASGNLIFGGLKSGAITRTIANIVAAVDATGKATNLDLTSPAAGQDFDDLPDGATYKKCTENEQTGAQYAFAGFSADGMIDDVYSTTRAAGKTATQVYDRVNSRQIIHVVGDTGGAAVALPQINQTGSGAFVAEMRIPFLVPSTYIDTIYFKCYATSGDGLGELQLSVYTSAGVLLGTSAAPTVVSAIDPVWGNFECSIDVSGFGLVANDLLYIDLEFKTTIGKDGDIEGGVFSIDFQ